MSGTYLPAIGRFQTKSRLVVFSHTLPSLHLISSRPREGGSFFFFPSPFQNTKRRLVVGQVFLFHTVYDLCLVYHRQFPINGQIYSKFCFERRHMFTSKKNRLSRLNCSNCYSSKAVTLLSVVFSRRRYFCREKQYLLAWLLVVSCFTLGCYNKFEQGHVGRLLCLLLFKISWERFPLPSHLKIVLFLSNVAPCSAKIFVKSENQSFVK